MNRHDGKEPVLYGGIDLGGTSIKGGVFSSSGDLVGHRVVGTPVSGGFRAVVEATRDLLADLARVQQLDLSHLETVGVGVPGISDKQGRVFSAHNLNWKEMVPLKQALEEVTGASVTVANDADVAAYAEWKRGSLQGVANGVLITVGTGIGGGFILNGQLYSGSGGFGAELGHMIIQADGVPCNCGSIGCLEAYASASSMHRYVLEQLKNGADSELGPLLASVEDHGAGRIIFDAAQRGDGLAIQAIERMTRYLAVGIGNLITLLEPEIIAIGGGVSQAGDYFMAPLRKAVEQVTFLKGQAYGTSLVVAQMENHAGIIGAGLLGREGK